MNVNTKRDPWGLLVKHKITAQDEFITTIQHCCDCSRVGETEVWTPDYTKWLGGMLVQDAFPYVAPEHREWLFVSGTCPECWDTMWADYVEEDFDFDDEA